MTTATRTRIDPTMTPAEKRQAVEGMLRELAYVLHVTRKVSRHVAWPADAARVRPMQDAPAAASV